MRRFRHIWYGWLALPGTKKAKFIVECTGIVVVAAYTSVAFLQLRDMNHSTDAVVATVRAWVYPADIDPPSPSEIRPNARFPIKFKNGGKTPALELILSEDFKYWDRGSPKEPVPRFSPCPKTPLGTTQHKYGALDVDQARWLDPPTVNIQLTAKQSSQLIALKAALFIHVCLEYQTVTGQKGLTDYCSVAYGADLKATAPCLLNPLNLK